MGFKFKFIHALYLVIAFVDFRIKFTKIKSGYLKMPLLLDDKYRVVKKIGESGSCKVYCVEDL